MVYLVKLEESHTRKLSCTSLPQNVSTFFYMASKSVHLPRSNCTHSTSLLLVFWWSCLIHLVLLLWKTAADILALTAKRTSWNTLQKFMFKRNLWPCTRLFCDTLCTYRIIVSFLFYSVSVFQRMYFVYACSTNVLVNKDWYIFQ